MEAKYKINDQLCVNCGLCSSVCVVFEKQNNKVTTKNPGLCIECGHCESICPKGAIQGIHSVETIDPKQKQQLFETEEILTFLKQRRSIRKYKKKPLSETDLELILMGAQYSPTGSNAQDVSFIVINDLEVIQSLKDELLPTIYKLFGMASKLAASPVGPLMLGKKQAYKLQHVYGQAMEVFKERNATGEDRLFYHSPALMIAHGEKQDEAIAFSSHIAMHNCALVAQTLGIGTLLNSFALMGINQSKSIKKRLGIPDGNTCFGVMTLGYEDITYKKSVHRKPVQITRIDKF